MHLKVISIEVFGIKKKPRIRIRNVKNQRKLTLPSTLSSFLHSNMVANMYASSCSPEYCVYGTSWDMLPRKPPRRCETIYESRDPLSDNGRWVSGRCGQVHGGDLAGERPKRTVRRAATRALLRCFRNGRVGAAPPGTSPRGPLYDSRDPISRSWNSRLLWKSD